MSDNCYDAIEMVSMGLTTVSSADTKVGSSSKPETYVRAAVHDRRGRHHPSLWDVWIEEFVRPSIGTNSGVRSKSTNTSHFDIPPTLIASIYITKEKRDLACHVYHTGTTSPQESEKFDFFRAMFKFNLNEHIQSVQTDPRRTPLMEFENQDEMFRETARCLNAIKDRMVQDTDRVLGLVKEDRSTTAKDSNTDVRDWEESEILARGSDFRDLRFEVMTEEEENRRVPQWARNEVVWETGLSRIDWLEEEIVQTTFPGPQSD